MKSLGQRASGLRLERMRASPRYRVTERGEGFHNVHPIAPGLRDSTERPSLGDFLFADGRRKPAGPLPAVNPLDAWLKPAGSGLRATWLGHSTVLIEIDEKSERETFLFEAKGLDRAFALIVDGARCRGKHDEARESPDRTTAVHYLKFQLEPAAEAALRDVLAAKRKAADVVVEVVVEHPRYTARTTLPASLVQSLAEDLA